MFASAVLVLAALVGQPVPALALTPPPDRTQWIKDHAIPLKTVEAGNGLDDLEPLKKLIGNARIVALGEPTHGTREAFQMKHRLVEFLASQMGFTIFSIEANMPESFAVDDYVSGGRGRPERLIAGMYFWTWNTHEVADMVRWMRGFNAKGSGNIRFTGFDMQYPDVAMKTALDLVKKIDRDYAASARGTYTALRSVRDTDQTPFGVATGSFPVDAAAGKHLVYSGWIKTRDLSGGYAGLWWRVDGKEGVAAFDNMSGRGPKGTTDWARYTVELDIPADAININFGVLMPGRGKAWFDDLKVELSGKEFTEPDLFDFGFEGGAIKGLTAPSAAANGGYAAELDATQAHGGVSSLRLTGTASAADKPEVEGPTPAAAAKLAKSVLEHMESSRDAYARATNDDETDWAIQNARVVTQCYRMRAGNGPRVRDESMAANVKWILDNSPANTKIILWAHNGHVNRQAGRMGSHLAKVYGKDLVVLGFAASAGRYSAYGDKGVAGYDLAPAPGGSFEWHCQATGLSNFILNTRDASPDDPASSWLTGPIQIRSIGAAPMEQQFTTQDLSIAYDAIVYLRDTTEARQLGK